MVEIADGVPPVEEYRRLRADVGWPSPSDESCARALGATLFGVTARTADGSAVGMARVVGDGGIYLFVVDVVVSPAHQGVGVGRLIMDRVRAWAIASGASHVALAADPAVAKLYQKWGFRPQNAHYLRLTARPL